MRKGKTKKSPSTDTLALMSDSVSRCGLEEGLST